MASQTGTLKFRQSDGTYTELYPKTTIAQVDGLQTQLDSINTSLQNKVGYISSDNKSIQIERNWIEGEYFRVARFSYGAYLIWEDENKKGKYALACAASNYGNKPFFVDYSINKNYILATTEDITNAIGNAINSSY